MYSIESPGELRILIKSGKTVISIIVLVSTKRYIDEQSIIGYGTRFQSSVDSNLKV